MAAIDGQWDSVVQSPMGEQKSLLTLVGKPDGSFAGTNSGAFGAVEISGNLAGSEVTFRMAITLPLPMTLTARATVAGDEMNGTVTAGGFGDYPFTATRRG